MKLTPKQRAFCHFYIESLNAKESALKAGYSEKTAGIIGAENLSKPYIKQYINEHLAQKDNERIMGVDKLLERYSDIAQGKLTEEQIVVYNNRHERVRKEPSFKDQLKAMEQLAKRYSLFADKKEVVGDFSLSVDYGEADDDTSESES